MTCRRIVFSKSYTTGDTCGAGIAYPSWVFEFPVAQSLMFCVVRYGFLSVVLFLSFFSNGYDYPFGISTFSLHGIFYFKSIDKYKTVILYREYFIKVLNNQCPIIRRVLLLEDYSFIKKKQFQCLFDVILDLLEKSF
jgi:hypothetical protein